MSGVNKVILIGNLGADPTVRNTQSGAAVANFNVATTERYNDRNGERQERTEWHRIVMHGIWQKALVVTEPCTAAPPFEANVDYVEEELDAIPERIQYFLSSEKGREEARIFTERAFKTLTEECSLTQCLSPVLADLEQRTNSRRT